MKYLLIVISMLSCLNVYSNGIEVEKAYVYKQFYRSGSSAMIIRAFSDSLDFNSITNKVEINLEDSILLQEILNNANIKRHHQMKIIIELALDIKIGGKNQYFIINNAGILINLSTGKNYVIKNKTYKEQLSQFIDKYKQ